MAPDAQTGDMGAGPGAARSGGPGPPSRGGPENPWQATRPRGVALYLLLLLACVLPYHRVMDNYLFNDDFLWMRTARYEMTSGNTLSYRVVGFFRPIVNLSFYLQERLAPGHAPLYYAVNLLLHFINAVLVMHLVGRVLGRWWIAAATSILFALTSVHSGAVLWISARTTLLSTMLLLVSLVLLAGHRGGRSTLPAALLAYALALAAKETAVVGLPLLALAWAFLRAREEYRAIGPAALGSFAVLTVLYLALRAALLGGFVQENWGPGPHMLRNIGGGMLYQLHPGLMLAALWPRAGFIPESPHPFLPEAAAVPVLLLLGLAAARWGRPREMLFALGWAVVGLVPMSPFGYRFLSTVSFSQNRYYYLSSVGTVLAIVLLLSMIRPARSKIRAAAAGILFLLFCAGHSYRVMKLETKYDNFTGMYRNIISALLDEVDRSGRPRDIAVEDSWMAFRYLEAGVKLERPVVRLFEVRSEEEARRRAPCLYIAYTGSGAELRMKIKELRP